MTAPGLRIDKWLWFARFFKTRTLATAACQSRRVRVDGTAIAKPGTLIRPGQVLSFMQGERLRVIKVEALGTRRGPAPEAQALYEDLDPPKPPEKKAEATMPEPFISRPRGSGRPTKKDRRDLDRFFDGE